MVLRLLLLGVALQHVAARPPLLQPTTTKLTNPGPPVKIAYNHRAMTVDGVSTLWIAGTAQYPRFTPKLWPAMFELAKQNNLNAITSYIFWDIHEPEHGGAYDFTGRKDIGAFLQAAHDAGLWVHLRFGPYIDAEWDYGGFPWWLNSLEGSAMPKCLRCSDLAFEGLMKTWLIDFVEHVRPFFASNGGPVAMIQIENELDCLNGIDYAKWSINTAIALDTGIPWSFCNNSASCVLENTDEMVFTGNAGEGPDQWFDDGNYDHYSTTPALWSEVEEGFDQWQVVGWDPQLPDQLANNICRFMSRGGGGFSYYTFDGGNDYGMTAGDDDATKYTTHGEVEPVFHRPNEPKFSHLAKLHRILGDFNELIVGQVPPQNVTHSAGQCVSYTYTNATLSLMFLYNPGEAAADCVVTATLAIKMQPQSHVLLTNLATEKTWTQIYDTSVCDEVSGTAVPCINPTGVGKTTVAVPKLSWSRYQEPLTAMPVVAGTHIDEFPTDFVRKNHHNSDYAWYTTHVTPAQLAAAAGTNASADVTISALLYAETVAHVYMDGKYVAFLNNEPHNGVPMTKTATLPASALLRKTDGTSTTLSILAMCVGLSADNAGTGVVGDAGINGTVMLGTQDLTRNAGGWLTQPRLYGEFAGLPTAVGGMNVTWTPLVPKKETGHSPLTKHTPPPHSACSKSSFPISESKIECTGLNRQPTGDESQETCIQACCSQGEPWPAPPTCGVWQYDVDQGLCYSGRSCLSTTPNPSFEGASRTTAPAPAPVGPIIAPPAGWLQATFAAPAGWPSAHPLAIDMRGSNKGHIYLNGFDCGRYWYDPQIDHSMQRFYQLPPDYIVAGVNRIVLFEEKPLYNSFFVNTTIVKAV